MNTTLAKEFVIAAIVSGLYALGTSIMISHYVELCFIGHQQFYYIPMLELMGFIWVSLLFFIYLRPVSQYIAAK